MKRLLWVAAAIAMCGCANNDHRQGADPLSSGSLSPAVYLDLLDGSEIYPIEGARAVVIHSAPRFSFIHIESGEIIGRSVVRFKRVVTGIADIHASQENFALEMHTLTDTRTNDPTSSELLLYDPRGEPSLVGALALEIVTPHGKTLSKGIEGSEPNEPYIQWILQRCMPTIPLASDEGFRQGQLISHRKQVLWQNLEIESQVTVEGRGTYRRRPVIVIKLVGDVVQPIQKKKVGTVGGYAFLDEKVGVISHESMDVVLPASDGGSTRSVILHLSSDFVLP